jgi:superfamily II DNA or RNA helicase
MFDLRDYQKKASEGILRAWETVDSTLAVLPTGAGKTVVFADVIKKRENLGRALVLAHRKELIGQAADKIFAVTGIEPEIEMGAQKSSGGNVVCASVQTIDSRWEGGAFSTIIIDEAHHAVSDQFLRVVKSVSGPNTKILGVTATPDRADKKNIGSFFQSLAYETNLLEMIRDGYLSPISVVPCPVGIDLSRLTKSGGDFTAHSCEFALWPNLEKVATELMRVASDRKTIAFLPLVRTSMAFCEMLKKIGFNAIHIDGSMNDAFRGELLQRFKDSGAGSILCNSMLLTEGFDEPSIDCVAVLRPTMSRPLYSQMIGRGTRLSPGKNNLLVPDFLWMTGKHSLIRPCNLLAKDAAEAKRMNEIVESATEELSFDDISSSSDEVKAQREEALRKALAAASKNQNMVSRKNLDPISFCLDVGAVDAANYAPSPANRWQSEPPTQKQISAIQKFRISTENIKSKGHASKILDVLMSRAKLNLATPKQIELLKKLGHENPFEATRYEAQVFISANI